jgi:hypothetical protein
MCMHMDTCACTQRAHLVDVCPVCLLHLVKFVDAADALVREHERATLQHQLLGHLAVVVAGVVGVSAAWRVCVKEREREKERETEREREKGCVCVCVCAWGAHMRVCPCACGCAPPSHATGAPQCVHTQPQKAPRSTHTHTQAHTHAQARAHSHTHVHTHTHTWLRTTAAVRPTPLLPLPVVYTARGATLATCLSSWLLATPAGRAVSAGCVLMCMRVAGTHGVCVCCRRLCMRALGGALTSRPGTFAAAVQAAGPDIRWSVHTHAHVHTHTPCVPSCGARARTHTHTHTHKSLMRARTHTHTHTSLLHTHTRARAGSPGSPMRHTWMSPLSFMPVPANSWLTPPTICSSSTCGCVCAHVRACVLVRCVASWRVYRRKQALAWHAVRGAGRARAVWVAHHTLHTHHTATHHTPLRHTFLMSSMP